MQGNIGKHLSAFSLAETSKCYKYLSFNRKVNQNIEIREINRRRPRKLASRIAIGNFVLVCMFFFFSHIF